MVGSTCTLLHQFGRHLLLFRGSCVQVYREVADSAEGSEGIIAVVDDVFTVFKVRCSCCAYVAAWH